MCRQIQIAFFLVSFIYWNFCSQKSSGCFVFSETGRILSSSWGHKESICVTCTHYCIHPRKKTLFIVRNGKQRCWKTAKFFELFWYAATERYDKNDNFYFQILAQKSARYIFAMKYEAMYPEKHYPRRQLCNYGVVLAASGLVDS